MAKVSLDWLLLDLRDHRGLRVYDYDGRLEVDVVETVWFLQSHRAGHAIRKRSGHFTVIRTLESILHLNPYDPWHVISRRHATEYRGVMKNILVANVAPPSSSELSSLGGGILLDRNGGEMTGEAHTKMLEQIRLERSHYVKIETNRHGKPYDRRRTCDPLRQFCITVFPAHDLAFRLLELSGLPIRKAILLIARNLLKEAQALIPWRLLSVIVHPDESKLHFHFIVCVVDEQLSLLHSEPKRGQPARRLLGIGCVGTLRLTNGGIWPESDAEFAKAELTKCRERWHGDDAYNWLLSCSLDGWIERFFEEHMRDPRYNQPYQQGLADYTRFAREQREMRPDVLAQTVVNLRAELLSAQRQVDESAKRPATHLEVGPRPGGKVEASGHDAAAPKVAEAESQIREFTRLLLTAFSDLSLDDIEKDLRLAWTTIAAGREPQTRFVRLQHGKAVLKPRAQAFVEWRQGLSPTEKSETSPILDLLNQINRELLKNDSGREQRLRVDKSPTKSIDGGSKS